MYVYELSPIDHWGGWMSEEQYLADCENKSYLSTDKPHERRRLEKLKKQAFDLAKRLKIGWEGDFAEGPYFSPIPAEGGNSGCELLLAWKQRNNGTTFIASPYPLPWLAKECEFIGG